MQEPISDERASHDGALPTDHVSPHEPPSWGQPYERTIGADLFQLGSLGSLGSWAGANLSTAQIAKSQSPIPKIQPELDHLLPNTTTTPAKQINPHTTSSYHLRTPQATKHSLSPNLHNPRFSLTPSTPQPHHFSPSLTLSSLRSTSLHNPQESQKAKQCEHLHITTNLPNYKPPVQLNLRPLTAISPYHVICAFPTITTTTTPTYQINAASPICPSSPLHPRLPTRSFRLRTRHPPPTPTNRARQLLIHLSHRRQQHFDKRKGACKGEREHKSGGKRGK